ncbi:MAG: transposase [Chloroflexota bacterium]
MARHLRLEFEGAIYHVTSRGNERSDIFKEDADKERFLEKLAENVEQHHVRLYAYVIMTNHYHLLVETPRGNLSRFMQQLNTSYTMYHNVRHDRVGHVFSGRYKAKVVSGDEYLLVLTRYIHLNPVKIASMKDRPLAEKIEYLRKYRWSSYSGYTGLWKKEGWVDYAPLEGLAGRYRTERKESYRVFVESGLAEDDEDLKEALNRSSKAVGGWKFCRWVEKTYRQVGKDAGRKADVAMRRVEVGVGPEEIERLVGETFGVDGERLKLRRSKEDARLVAAKLMKEHSGLTQRDIGMRLGLADGSGLGHLLGLADKRLAGSRKLRLTYEKLESAL